MHTCTALKIDVGGMFAISLQKKYVLNQMGLDIKVIQMYQLLRNSL